MGSPIYLHVDTKDASELIAKVRAVHTEREFQLLMYRVFKRTGEHVKAIMRKDVPIEYEAKAGWVGSNVGAAQTSFGGGGGQVSCSIPIDGTRGVLGSTFKAAGPRGRRAKGKRYKITAKIVKGASSTLPSTMEHQGGQPPFIAKNKRIVFTRTTKERFPIARVVGLGVPQMPMNRSQDDVQGDIMKTLTKRIEHEHELLISRCR